MKIPEDRKPYEVIINGVKKTYEGGATVADDAAVKEIIDNADTFPPEALPAETPFPIPEQSGGTNVVANPTLAGDEDSLTGIQIGDTKYAVGGSSGGGALIVTISKSGSTWTADKTVAEILAAINAGQHIYETYTNDITNESTIVPLSSVNIAPSGAYVICFVNIEVDGGVSSYGHKILSIAGQPDVVIEVAEFYPDE